jgi:mannose-6-phosphate isomerase-like protein (cupin superfamily)
MLEVDGEELELREGHAAFVPAGAEHCFSAYEHLTVLTILEKRSRPASGRRSVTGSVS